jgi:serine protease Do
MTSRQLAGLLVALNLLLLGIVFYQQVVHMAPDAPPGRSLTGEPPLAAAATASSGAPAPTVAPRGMGETDVERAAAVASQAVVAVGGTVVQSIDPFFEQFYGFSGRRQTLEIPFVGSGVLIDNQGHLVTNVHVIEQVSNPFITLSNGTRVAAKLVDKDNRVDVALLKADLPNSPYAPMGNSDALVPGQWVIAIGNPYGDAIPDLRPTVTFGVVSALHRNYKAENLQTERIYLDMVQTDAAINPGNSGGALVNLRGEVVGINTFIVSRSGGSVGLGFAIPINRVRGVVDEILKYGRVRNYVLDFDVLDLTPQVARYLAVKPDRKGAVVRIVYERNGPAVKAGLEVGDIVVGADSLPIESRGDLLNYFLSLHVGATIDFRVIRDGKERALSYRIEEYNR